MSDNEGKKDPVASMAGQIRHLGNGPRAEIARLGLRPSASADGTIYGMLGRAGVDFQRMREDEMEAWRITAFAAAISSGSGGAAAHAPGQRMGRALRDAGFSETRLVQLAGNPTRDRIMRAARLLAKGRPYDLWGIRNLADPDPETRAKAARVLVRDYHASGFRKPDDG
jgi:hypothetical protein